MLTKTFREVNLRFVSNLFGLPIRSEENLNAAFSEAQLFTAMAVSSSEEKAFARLAF